MLAFLYHSKIIMSGQMKLLFKKKNESFCSGISTPYPHLDLLLLIKHFIDYLIIGWLIDLLVDFLSSSIDPLIDWLID